MNKENKLDKEEKYKIIIREAGFPPPTPFQEKVITASFKKKQIIVELAPNNEQILAIAIPVVLQTDFSFPGLKNIIIASSTESVKKINTVFKKMFLKKLTSLQTAIANPHRDIKKEFQQLQRHPDIFIGTPDSIIDHIRSGNISLKDLQTCIIEDSMTENFSSFEHDIEFILSKMSGKQRFIVFSKRKESYNFFQFFKRAFYIKQIEGNKKEKTALNKTSHTISDDFIQDIMKDIKENSLELSEIAKIINANVPIFSRGIFTAYILKKLSEKSLLKQTRSVAKKPQRVIKDKVPQVSSPIAFPDSIKTQHPTLEQKLQRKRKSATSATDKTLSADKTPKAENNFVTIFINTGKNRGLFSKDLSNLIISTDAASKKDIGKIKIFDSYSFADIATDKADAVIAAVSNLTFKEKQLVAKHGKKEE